MTPGCCLMSRSTLLPGHMQACYVREQYHAMLQHTHIRLQMTPACCLMSRRRLMWWHGNAGGASAAAAAAAGGASAAAAAAGKHRAASSFSCARSCSGLCLVYCCACVSLMQPAVKRLCLLLIPAAATAAGTAGEHTQSSLVWCACERVFAYCACAC